MIFKEKYEDYTEAEFLSVLNELFYNDLGLQGDAYGAYSDSLMDHFERITEHPDRSDVICYPKPGQEDSPAGVLKTIKEWRALNNKPGFKAE